ncbi:MAG: hypothetical protein M1840_001224 [Geoglossum simile]|nr:MAG: hypothetical protein M1840_001224 [Geoglossum simile]
MDAFRLRQQTAHPRVSRSCSVSLAWPLSSELWKLHLQPDEFEELAVPAFGTTSKRIADPSTKALAFRMPSPTHEQLSALVIEQIILWLGSLRDDTSMPKVAKLARLIMWSASTRINLDPPGSTRCPDASFYFGRRKYPSVIIETSFSQRGRQLDNLVEEYIMGSRANVQLVVGLDIGYPKPTWGTVSVWTPEYFEDNGKYFRHRDLFPELRSGALTLPLSAFIPRYHSPPVDPVISIPYLDLDSFLKTAENHHHRTQGGTVEEPPSIEELKELSSR